MRDSIGHSPGVVLSGGTGFLGGELLARLLEQDDRTVYVLVRAEGQAAARQRVRATLTELTGDPKRWAGRVVAIPADLTRDGLGLSRPQLEWLPSGPSGSSTARHPCRSRSGSPSRGRSTSTARAGCSTWRSSPTSGGCCSASPTSRPRMSRAPTPGTFSERDLDLDQDHRNPYERSKLEAEVEVAREGRQPAGPGVPAEHRRRRLTDGLDAGVQRPLLAVACVRPRQLPVLPATRTSPVDVVPVDYVADALLALGGRPGTTFHLTAADRASSLDDLVTMACDQLDRRRPRLLSPPSTGASCTRSWCAPGASDDGERSAAASRSSRTSRWTRPMTTPRRARPWHRAASSRPRSPAYFDRLIEYALRAEWGRRQVPRHHLLAPSRPRAQHREGRIHRPPTREQPVVRR